MTEDLLNGPSEAPASGAAPRSIVVLLHGYGSNGSDLIGFVPYWRDALPDTLFLAPDAPQACPGTAFGRQWWPLTSLAPEARAAGVRVSAPALNAFIDHHLAAHGLVEDRLALVGFSQGTMMALHVAPRRQRPIAGVVGYAGMLADPDALGEEVRSKPPILLAHGDADDVLPLTAMRQAEARLTALGFPLQTYVAAGLGHSVDAEGLALGARFLAETLASRP
ncbi:alpha/beta hydrolase [Phenylobacterium immobile]|uniref:alpha/beta hydrolase n=1 Tax=Phenylobacterium immobile TaxID=21 RepID=UPI000AFA2BDC|nr:dienelactone hydrolase family protein [Phenylobacterium immobile]